jgi:predicted DNA-binding transcriptional regulator AlpA
LENHTPFRVLHNYARKAFFILPSCVNWRALRVNRLRTFSKFVYNFCMMPVMVKEADLDRIDVPEDYEVLDATALGRRLGFKRGTVLAYLSRRNFGRIPRPNRLLAMGPLWYEKSVREWQVKEEGRARGKLELCQPRVREPGRRLAPCPEGAPCATTPRGTVSTGPWLPELRTGA